MRTSIGSFFLYLSSGDGSAHAARLHLSAWLCDPGLSRHAHGVAQSPSSHILLAYATTGGVGGVWWFSVEPGEIGLTALEEAGDGINQDAKDRLAQLTAGLAQR